ncbi:MAG: hypothetical protein K0Q72_3052 [Armatimonadetes bacterium]|nr:hypothetical protein [Armatimonadota bacterium]
MAIRNGASGAPERSTPAASEERVRGEVVSVTPGRNASITVRSEGVRQTYRLERDTVVLLGPEGRRGVATELAQVRPGATVRLRLNATRDSAEMIEVFTRAGEDRTGSGSGPRTQRDPVDRGGRNPSASESVWGELIAIRARGERTTLTVQTRSGRESFELARDAEVTRTAAGRRNEQALHNDLRVGDRVRLTQDQDGGITRVDARGPGSSTPGAAPTSSRTLTGEVTAVRTGANPPTMTVTAGGRRTTLEVTRETDIYRAPGAGRRAVRANLDELQPGDTVRIRTDVTGTIAETIDVE